MSAIDVCENRALMLSLDEPRPLVCELCELLPSPDPCIAMFCSAAKPEVCWCDDDVPFEDPVETKQNCY